MNKRGFTLIELMVSVTIFIVVMVISLGSLLSISSAERKAESLKTVMNNLHFALESMSRTIRTGVNYHCYDGGSAAIDEPQDCASGDDYFAFETVEGDPDDSSDQVVYRFESNASTCGQTGTGGCIMRSINGGSSFVPITSPEVVISNLTFYVIGSVPQFSGDSTSSQPKVVITLNGSVTIGTAAPSQFRLQTTVTQRLYDQ